MGTHVSLNIISVRTVNISKYLFLVAMVLLPFSTFAATYHYVTTSGETASVSAQSSEEALRIAPESAPNSGVVLDQGFIEPGMNVPMVSMDDTVPMGTGGSNTFHYVTTSGITATVQANDPETALMIAPNRMPDSGVAIDIGIIESGTFVPGAM